MAKELEPFFATLQLFDIVNIEELPTVSNTIKTRL